MNKMKSNIGMLLFALGCIIFFVWLIWLGVYAGHTIMSSISIFAIAIGITIAIVVFFVFVRLILDD